MSPPVAVAVIAVFCLLAVLLARIADAAQREASAVRAHNRREANYRARLHREHLREYRRARRASHRGRQ